MRRRVLATLVALALLGCSALAASRPGGGQTYSSGSGADSRDDDSDGDGGAAVLVALIELCIRYPKVGVPLLLLALAFVGYRARYGSVGDWDSVNRAMHADAAPDALARRAKLSLDQVRGVDADFSLVLFEDFVFRLYATAQHYRGEEGKLDELAPYLSAAARRALADRPPVRQPVTAVVIGKMRVYRVSVPAPDEPSGEFGAFAKVGVQFEANYSVGSGEGNRRFVVEDWLLQRAATARTKPPSVGRRFPCPNCGAPWRTEQAAGTQKCAFCGAVVDNGRFDWQVAEIKLRRETANLPGLETDVPEMGTSLPTVVDDRFAEQWSALLKEDPHINDASIAARLRYIYTVVNDAWSHGDLRPARAILSDGLADYFQYWVDAYDSRGLRNVLEDMRLTRHELVKLARDRYYDALTIRIWATGKDYVVQTKDGSYVRGSRDRDRDYSEYWTLIRAAARRGPSRADPTCGSCGAVLTVTMSGECTHCGSHVTAGEFDWVLSKIEQDDAYSA